MKETLTDLPVTPMFIEPAQRILYGNEASDTLSDNNVDPD